MSDIYVKGWVSGIDDKQETDVHYRYVNVNEWGVSKEIRVDQKLYEL